MSTLSEKVQNLKVTAYVAGKTAQFWEQKIAEHGEQKAEQFYLYLGHNHIERKGFEWEGLTLSREPKEHEKLAVKGVHQAQQSAKESISTILLNLRQELITDGLEGISKLDPAKYHTLVLQAPPEFRKSLRDRLVSTYRQGRRLVATELGSTQQSGALFGGEPGKAEVRGRAVAGNAFKQDEDDEEDEFDDLDMLTDLTDARVVNDVQSRITSAAARFVLLGLTGAALFSAIQGEINTGSVSYIDRSATGVGNKVLAIGRMDEMRDRSDEIDRYEQSEILDENTCGPCAEDDGKTASDPDDLPGAPNPDCEGGDYCRGFIVAIVV